MSLEILHGHAYAKSGQWFTFLPFIVHFLQKAGWEIGNSSLWDHHQKTPHLTCDYNLAAIKFLCSSISALVYFTLYPFSTMATLSGLTTQEIETLSSKAIGAKANAYCMFHNKHHSLCTWRETLFYDLSMRQVLICAGPYSKFRVGACLLTKTGEFIAGANVENAAYPVGSCAERVAFGTAVVSI
jgi:hypothetical protein